MKEIDYLQFFEEVAIATRALNSTTPTRIDPFVAAKSGTVVGVNVFGGTPAGRPPC